MTGLRRYSFRLYPNAEQKAALERQAALTARLWNAALQQREDRWRREVERKGHWRRVPRPPEDKPKGLSYYDQARELKYLRADDPEFAAMSCASLELCLKALDIAFKAFWRRLKEGCDPGAAGYPRYKSARRHRTIWHRNGSGWKMTPHGKHWKFYFKGIGRMKARGRFPLPPDEIRTMEIVERNGKWEASVVVRAAPRRAAGRLRLEVRFDLLDGFAAVKNAADGECLPGLTPVFDPGEGRIVPQNRGSGPSSAPGAPDSGAGGKSTSAGAATASAPGAPDSGAGGKHPRRRSPTIAAPGGPGSADGGKTPSKADGGKDGGIEDGKIDALQSARDRRFRKFSYRWRREARRIAKRKAKAARIRKDALHRWTTQLVEEASEITVVAPAISEHVRSARGDAREWGAAVETVAALNRATLGYAAAMAIDMLDYKCAEAGVEFRRIEPDETPLAIGRDLPETLKKARRARRKLRKAA